MVDVLKLSNVFDVWQVYICVYLALFDQQQDEVLAFFPLSFSPDLYVSLVLAESELWMEVF